MADNITIPVPDTQEVKNIIERPNEAIPHVVEHEGRITHLEEQQAAKFAELLQKIEDTRQELFVAVEHARTEQAGELESRLKRLEEVALKMESTIVEAPPKVVEQFEEAPTEAVQLVPEVEREVKKTVSKGLRARRKARHHG